jgi:tRNA 2-selenouridine synthase
MLQQVGWRADVIQGGYQTYRRMVYRYLYDDALPFRLIALDGYTGTAKTELLHRVAALGGQVLDLEGLAHHRGSLRGEMPVPQPSQKAFESELAGQLCRLDPSRPVLVEAESNKIGARIIPPALWSLMKAAPRVQVTADAEARCAYLQRAYDDILSDADRLRQKLDPLRAHRSHAVVDGWFERIAAGDKAGLTRALIQQHYDPSYEKSRRAIGAEVLAELSAGDLSDASLDAAAARVMDLLG